jgi:hypothetical protein
MLSTPQHERATLAAMLRAYHFQSLAHCKLSLLAGVLATVACKKHPSAPPTASVSVAADAATAPNPAAPKAPATAVLDDWLGAQNRGDFAAYQSLYAEDFEASLHVAKRARAIKRSPWMAEQKRKFRKPMTVSISSSQVSDEGREARFSETWESGTYHEETDKIMRVALVAGAWRITKEEILAKKVDASKGAAMKSMAFLFVWEKQPVIVSEAADDCTVGKTRMSEASDTAVRPVDENRLSDDARQWKNEKLVLVDERLRECETTVTGFEMISVAEWDRGTIEGQIEGRKSESAVAAKIWEGTHQLVARTGDLSGDCERPVLARPARLPKLRINAFEEAETKLAEKAVAQFKALPEVAKMAAKAKEDNPDWEAQPAVTVASMGKAGSLVTVRVVGEGCGGPGYYAVAIWHTDKPDGKGAWQLVRSPGDDDQLTPLLAFDLDGDGVMEILYSDEVPNRLGLLRWNGESYFVDQTLKIPYLDCRC